MAEIGNVKRLFFAKKCDFRKKIKMGKNSTKSNLVDLIEFRIIPKSEFFPNKFVLNLYVKNLI